MESSIGPAILASVGPFLFFERGQLPLTANMRQAPRRGARRAAAKCKDARGASLTIRIDFGAFGFLGPGKIQLMELIAKHGSISAAGKEMGMSYRRAWLLVDEINHIFREPLVLTQMGGAGGGGAQLTEFGQEVIRRYRAIQQAAAEACDAHVRALVASLADKPRAASEEDTC